MIFPGFENLKGIEPALLAKGTTCNIYRRYYNRDMKLETMIIKAYFKEGVSNTKRQYILCFYTFNKYYDDLGYFEVPITSVLKEYKIRYRL